MLLFVAHVASRPVDEGLVAQAIREAARPYVQLDPDGLAQFTAPSGRLALAAIGHRPDQVAPRRAIARRDETVVCVDGLPVDARGRFAAWDAEALLEHWDDADVLDGLFAAVRVDLDAERIVCRTDPLGLGPLYAQQLADGFIVANSVAAIRRLGGAATPDPLGVASFLTLGWAAGGRTLVEPIQALRPGCRTTLHAGGRDELVEFTPARVVERARAARSEQSHRQRFVQDMVATTRAAVGGSGLPVKVAVTAGRDSRVVLALCLAAGLRPQTGTIGAETDADVVIGRRVAERAGLSHERWSPEAHGLFDADPVGAMQRFADLTDGLSSLMQLQDIGDLDGPVDHVGIQVSGVAGEIARSGAVVVRGFAAASPLAAGSVALQTRLLQTKARNAGGLAAAEAVAETRAFVERFVGERIEEGWRPDELTDAWYAFERVGRWGSTGVRRASPTDDLFTPFASSAFVTHAFALRPRERYAEVTHRHLLRALTPELLEVDFEEPWVIGDSRLAPFQSSLRMAGLIGARLGARVRPRNGGVPWEPPWVFRWLARHRDALRDVVLSTSAARLWDFADRAAVEAAFAQDPLADFERAEGLLRVASVATALDGG